MGQMSTICSQALLFGQPLTSWHTCNTGIRWSVITESQKWRDRSILLAHTAYLALAKYLCSFQARGIAIIADMLTDISHRFLSRTAELHALALKSNVIKIFTHIRILRLTNWEASWRKWYLKGETALNLLSNFMIMNNFYFAMFCPQRVQEITSLATSNLKIFQGTMPPTLLG